MTLDECYYLYEILNICVICSDGDAFMFDFGK